MKLILTIFIGFISAIGITQTFPEVIELPDQPTTVIEQVKPYNSPVDIFRNHGKFNNSDSTTNDIFNIGLNVNPGGGRVNSDFPVAYLQFENDYLNANGQRLSEIHFDFDNGRPFHAEYNHSTGLITTVMKSNNFNIVDSYNNVNVQLYSGLLMLQSGVILRSTTNNSDFIQQLNAAGTVAIKLIKADNTDTVVIGNATYKAKTANLEVAGILYLKDGTTKQVTFASNDSCGTGYKCLRIAN